MADIPADTSTTAVLTGTGSFASSLETSGDSDWWRVDLVAGLTYDFTLSGDGSASSLDDASFRILNNLGATLNSDYTYSGGPIVLSITASYTGSFYVAVADGSSDSLPEGNYVIRTRMNDLLPNDNSTTGVVRNGITAGSLEASGDADRYAVNLTAGQRVDFTLSGDGSANSLDDANFALLDQYGNRIDTDYTYSGGPIWVAATAAYTGKYYLVVADGSSDSAPEGNFRIEARLTDNVVANAATTAAISDGTTYAGRIDARGDADWVKLAAVSGRSYSFTLSGDGSASALAGKRLVLRDAQGNQISSDYTYGTDAITINWTSGVNGPVYLDVQGVSSTSGWGNYRLSVISDAPVLTGTAGADSLTGGANNNRILGLGGDDTLIGGAGHDRLIGGFGHDQMLGGQGIDTADYDGNIAVTVSLAITSAQSTGYGKDILRGIENLAGGKLGDRLTGDGGANTLEGRGGNDTLTGGAGNDRLYGGAGDDVLSGGADTDTAVYTAAGAVVVNLTTGRATGAEGNDTLAGIENVTTGAGNDVLRGNQLANVLNGGAGNDALFGGDRDDTLYGGEGADQLTGGLGNDRLFGGAGGDRFIFGRGDGRDLIADFQDGTDRIVFSSGADAMSDLRITASASGAVVWYDGGNIVLTNIAVNQLSAADFIFT